uniref:Uncharacterized protein n=1 Tax=Anopheles darlingi TaxID=43151 RepID=A0A2M4CX54_ANODA
MTFLRFLRNTQHAFSICSVFPLAVNVMLCAPCANLFHRVLCIIFTVSHHWPSINSRIHRVFFSFLFYKIYISCPFCWNHHRGNLSVCVSITIQSGVAIVTDIYIFLFERLCQFDDLLGCVLCFRRSKSSLLFEKGPLSRIGLSIDYYCLS